MKQYANITSKEWSQAALQTRFSLYRGQPFKAMENIRGWYYEAI